MSSYDYRTPFDAIIKQLARIADALEKRSAPPQPSVRDIVIGPPNGCAVCGLGSGGEVTGYVCSRMNCPSSARW